MITMESNEIHNTHRAGKDKELWYDFIIREKQATPQRIENAAKAVGGIISITLTLLLALFDNKQDLMSIDSYETVIVLWLIAAIVAFLVIFPFPYRYSSLSINSFIKSHRRTVIVKYVLLVVSVIAYLVGLVLLAGDVL